MCSLCGASANTPEEGLVLGYSLGRKQGELCPTHLAKVNAVSTQANPSAEREAHYRSRLAKLVQKMQATVTAKARTAQPATGRNHGGRAFGHGRG
jgi:hypothetical protein